MRFDQTEEELQDSFEKITALKEISEYISQALDENSSENLKLDFLLEYNNFEISEELSNEQKILDFAESVMEILEEYKQYYNFSEIDLTEDTEKLSILLSKIREDVEEDNIVLTDYSRYRESKISEFETTASINFNVSYFFNEWNSFSVEFKESFYRDLKKYIESRSREIEDYDDYVFSCSEKFTWSVIFQNNKITRLVDYLETAFSEIDEQRNYKIFNDEVVKEGLVNIHDGLFDKCQDTLYKNTEEYEIIDLGDSSKVDIFEATYSKEYGIRINNIISPAGDILFEEKRIETDNYEYYFFLGFFVYSVFMIGVELKTEFSFKDFRSTEINYVEEFINSCSFNLEKMTQLKPFAVEMNRKFNGYLRKFIIVSSSDEGDFIDIELHFKLQGEEIYIFDYTFSVNDLIEKPFRINFKGDKIGDMSEYDLEELVSLFNYLAKQNRI